jgi:hypothetical protein
VRAALDHGLASPWPSLARDEGYAAHDAVDMMCRRVGALQADRA